MSNVMQIAVHQNPHLDELVAVWLLRNYGEQKFPEISKAKLTVWGRKELAQTSPEMAAMSGILMVGLGQGMFDDHVGGRREDCSTTLVAKHLGLIHDASLKRLLQDVFQADSAAEGPLQAMAEEIKTLNRYWVGSIDLERLYNQIEPFIIARVERQKEYVLAHKRFEVCYRQRINGLMLVAVDGMDNSQFQHVARTKGAKVIIQRNEAGMTQIFGNDGLDMPGLAVRIRKSEIANSGLRLPHFLNNEELSVKGTIEGIPQWYLDNGFMLNGSESFTDVPPSKIRFSNLVYLVEKHITEMARSKAIA